MNNQNGQNHRIQSGGKYTNTGCGPTLQPIDIGHPEYIGLVDPDAAFWSLVKKDKLGYALTGEAFMDQYRRKRTEFLSEMDTLRFGLKPSAVYFNPTDRCNLNCGYCYIPASLRKSGSHMTEGNLLNALETLQAYFKRIHPDEVIPQVIFHGAEPMLNREAVFAGIERFKDDFIFGVQTNSTLLDESAIAFLASHNVSIGLSLDGVPGGPGDHTRKTWAGEGISDNVIAALERLKGYDHYSVICTVTTHNMLHLSEFVTFLHGMEVPVCMLNSVRCTLPGGRSMKPTDQELAKHYLAALDRTVELYEWTGRKLIVANFANILLSIMAPAARRLMCDISPCGGGRCFFAISAQGDIFPCSEFIGLPEFCGGNLFDGELDAAIESSAFRMVTRRMVEDIEPCRHCAVRHFCGSPCPAEAHTMNGGMTHTGAFCELYEEQARYALRQIADGKEDVYLWDGWDAETTTTFSLFNS